ncbi:MAG: hypothetical protein ACE5EK_02135 [Nitrospinales bacterium]
MKRYGMAFVLLVLTSALSAPALADEDPIRGCIDSRGYPVAWKVDIFLHVIAQAGKTPKDMPIITYNPDIFPFKKAQTRLFFYYHECGHHVLGHDVSGSISLQQEKRADCWAVNTLFYNGTFTLADIAAINRDLASLTVEELHQIPGPFRNLDLNECFR